MHASGVEAVILAGLEEPLPQRGSEFSRIVEIFDTEFLLPGLAIEALPEHVRSEVVDPKAQKSVAFWSH